MKRILLATVMSILLFVSSALATREIGDGTIGQYSYHSDNFSGAHNANGTVKSWLSSTNPMNTPAYQSAPFPISPAAGATAGGSFSGVDPEDGVGEFSKGQRTGKRLVRTSQEYAPSLSIAEVTVSVTTAKKVGEDYVNAGQSIGNYGANCHKKTPTPVTVASAATLPTAFTVAYEDDVEVQRVEFDCALTISGGTWTYTYTVTNHAPVDVAFSWPAVRTGDYPNGWSGVVPAEDSESHIWVGSGGAVQINGHPTDLLLDATGDAFAAHAAGAICPSAYVSQPSPVTNMSATYLSSPDRVSVSWTNAGSYDAIEVFRRVVGTADPERSWTLAGSSTSFVDLDPPSGTVEYTVYAVSDDVAAITGNPADEASVP